MNILGQYFPVFLLVGMGALLFAVVVARPWRSYFGELFAGYSVLFPLICGLAWVYSAHVIHHPLAAHYSDWAARCAIAVWPVLPFFIGFGGANNVVCRIGGYEWDANDFCRHWLITGSTGAGKTVAAINNLMHELCISCPTFGGISIDEKGEAFEVSNLIMSAHGRGDDLVLLRTRPDGAPKDWKPKYCYNPLSNPQIPANTYAQAIVKTFKTAAGSDGGGGGGHEFFDTQAQDQIAMGIELMRAMGQFPALNMIDDLLQSPDHLSAACDTLEKNFPGELTDKVTFHFRQKYLDQADDTRSSIAATTRNMLRPFSTPEIIEVFGQQENTVEFDQIDRGTVFCIALPQRLAIERQYLGTLLKVLFFQHARERFDKTIEQRKSENMLVAFMDEAQRFVDGSEDVDILRSAKTSLILATQQQNAFFPTLGKEKAGVFLGNLRNRVIFQAANEDCAEMNASFIGKKDMFEYSQTFAKGGGSRTKSKKVEYIVPPHYLRDLKKFPKFKAVICHCTKGHRIKLLKPRFPDFFEALAAKISVG